MKYDVADLSLAAEGKKRILWADNDMPVLALIRKQFSKTKPLKGKNISACLHITAETANLARTLKAAGANTVLCASNPLSTQDDVAASLVKDFKIPVFAICGENRNIYYKHIYDAMPLTTSPSLHSMMGPIWSMNFTQREKKMHTGLLPAWKKPLPVSSACGLWQKRAS
jgi:adenosylhomocysteinase